MYGNLFGEKQRDSNIDVEQRQNGKIYGKKTTCHK